MTVGHLFVIYGLDLLIVLLAIGSAATANVERSREPFPRLQLLMPGLLAFAGAIILLSYPDIRDLADPEVWLVSTVGLVTGGSRGALMRIESDHSFRVVRLWHGRDAAWAAWLMVLFATVQGSLETALRAENPYETTAEAGMLLAGGYLLGRSIVGWLRAQTMAHHDLKD
ncbi:MAG: hypothetical protein JSS04_20430 [Proteobacteria bacterium]|nr:hypothetical protein [Pseudomonadota bacterium]